MWDLLLEVRHALPMGRIGIYLETISYESLDSRAVFRDDRWHERVGVERNHGPFAKEVAVAYAAHIHIIIGVRLQVGKVQETLGGMDGCATAQCEPLRAIFRFKIEDVTFKRSSNGGAHGVHIDDVQVEDGAAGVGLGDDGWHKRVGVERDHGPFAHECTAANAAHVDIVVGVGLQSGQG